MINDMDYDNMNNIDLDVILSDLPLDLIKESIKGQVDEPLSTTTDFCTIVYDKCGLIYNLYRNDEDVQQELGALLDDFSTYVLKTLDEKYEFDINFEEMTGYKRNKITLILYKFFILRYKENVKTFIYNFILKNKRMLSENYQDTDKRKDVTTILYKKKTKNKDNIRIIANLPNIIKDILNIEHDPIDFMELCSPPDLYYGEEIKIMLDDFTLSGNFTSNYLNVILDKYEDVIDEIMMEVRCALSENLLN